VPAVSVVILVVVAPVLHTNSTPPEPVTVSVAIEPEQTVSLATAGAGSAFTVAMPWAVAEHPEELVAVTVYTPAAVVVIVSLVAPVLHIYVAPVPMPETCIVSIPPAHVAGLLTVGLGLDALTVPLAVAVHPAALVAVTVYVPTVDVDMVVVVAPVFHL